jgi:tRNA nucleotidyltransferase (CCA-adding enzyme)
LRLAIRFSFQVSDDTLRLMDRAVALKIFAESEGTRLRRELLLALQEDEPLANLRAFEERGLLRACLQDYQLAPHEPYILSALEWTGWYRLQMGHPVDHEDTLLLGSLALGSTATREQKIFSAFKIPVVEAEHWSEYRAAAVELEGKANRKKAAAPASEWVQMLEPAGETEILLWAIMHPERREAVTNFLTQWRNVKLAISGEDLKAMGIPKGPEMGSLLSQVRQAVLDEKCPPERQAQLALVKSLRK